MRNWNDAIALFWFLELMVKNGCALGLTRLNKTLITPVHRGPTLNDILLRLAGITFLTLINASADYHDLKLDKKSSYSITFSCPFGR